MPKIIILLFLAFTALPDCDTIPVCIIQHSMREKPYNDTLTCSWFSFKDDTVSTIEYRDKGVKIFRKGKGRNYYSRRFYTVLEMPPKRIVLILRGKINPSP